MSEEGDAQTYCGVEYGETREGECECQGCIAGPFPDPLQDWPMPGYLLCECGKPLDSFACRIRHLHFDTSWTKGDH